MNFVTIQHLMASRGVSRASIYRDLAAGHFEAKKAGRRTLIDLDGYNAYVSSLPKATFRSKPAGAVSHSAAA